MTKNKLIWTIVLVSLLIASLPIVHAQTFTSSLFYILINSLIVGVILFLLQSILIPGKNPKEQTAVWVAIIVGSLLIGFFFGSQGFIWNHPVFARFFSIYVLVNAIVIGTVLYFLSGFLDINKRLGGSPEGKGGLGILIFLISLIFAVNIGNQFIWHQAVVKQFIDYLFGAQGILNPAPPEYRLWAFLAVGTLLAFFFQGYLLQGVAGGTKINYALAILIASSVARAGISFQSIVLLGEAIFTIVLAKALKGTAPDVKGKSTNWILAAFLVGWASAAMTYGTEYQGWLAWIVGTPLWAMGLIQVGPTGVAARPEGVRWFGWIFKLGGGALVLALLILLFFFFIGRGEIRRRILTLGLAGLKERWNAIIRSAKFLRDTPEGREPQVFRENRILLHALVNFTTRSEITYRYWGFVEQGKRVGTQVLKDKIGIFDYDTKTLREDIIKARSGGTTSRRAHLDGWNRLNLDVVDLVNEFYELTYWVHISVTFGFKILTEHRNETIQYNQMIERAQNLLTKIETSRENYRLMTNAFGGHHVLNAYKGIILNMTNPTGDVLEHPQKFARPGAEFEGGSGYYGPSFTAGSKLGLRGITLPIHEVNQYGEYIQDIVNQKDAFGDLPSDPRQYKKPRKLKNPNNIIDYTDYSTLMSNIDLDWLGLAEDIRYGKGHPHSRTFQMYKKGLAKAIYPEWADDKIPIDNILTPPISGDEAVDLRALANPSKHDYWGRITFDATQPQKKEDPKHNPFPGLSSLGIKKYLQERVRLDMKDKAKAAEFMWRIPADAAATKKVVRGKEVVVKIGGRLSEGVEEAPKPS